MGNGEASEVPSKLKTVILNVSWTTEGLAINPLEPELQRGSPALRRGKAILEVPSEAEACAVGVGRLFTKRPWRGWQGEWTQRTVKGPSSLKALRHREPQPCAGISATRRTINGKAPKQTGPGSGTWSPNSVALHES